MTRPSDCPAAGGEPCQNMCLDGCKLRNRRALSHPAPLPVQTDHCEDALNMVQADQSLEVVAWNLECQTLGGDTGWILSWSRSGAGLCNRLSGVEHEVALTDHAKATAALAQKEAEAIHWKQAYVTDTAALEQEVATLRAQLAEAEKDARNWRQYQARKQAIIAAGMGKNPLRDAALSSPAQARTHDQG